MRRSSVLAFLALAATATAAAQTPPKPAPAPLLFLSPSGEPFHESAAMPDPLGAWFAQVETRRQGFIDRDEFRADAARFFSRLDENHDGVIDGFEVSDYEHKIAPELDEWAEGRAPGEFAKDHKAAGRRGPAPRAIAQLIYEPEPVSGADLDLDTRITRAEWMTATDQRFDILDTDHTGRLTLDALRKKLTGPSLVR